MIKYVRRLIRKNKTADRLVNSYDFRTVVFSTLSMLGGIGFAIFNTVVFSITDSMWCGAMVFYHVLLVSLRWNLLRHYFREHRQGAAVGADQTLREIKRYRICGIVLIGLTFCLMALILFIVRGDKVFSYGMYAVYTVTGYTLFQIVIAAANYIKAQKRAGYTVRALRCINFASALVSFISVQAISLDTFSANVNVPLMNALTGMVISALITVMGVYMIVHSTVRMKRIRENKPFCFVSQSGKF